MIGLVEKYLCVVVGLYCFNLVGFTSFFWFASVVYSFMSFFFFGCDVIIVNVVRLVINLVLVVKFVFFLFIVIDFVCFVVLFVSSFVSFGSDSKNVASFVVNFF